MNTKTNADEITIEELRKEKEFKHLSDEECRSIISNLKRWSILLYDIYKQYEEETILPDY